MTSAWRSGNARWSSACTHRLERGLAIREVTRASADIMDASGKSTMPYPLMKWKTPFITHLNPANGPELNGGTGYVNFDGADSEGAVITLEAGDAVYSVVIPSSGKIEVVEGKASLPGQENFQRPPIPDLLGYAAEQSGSGEGPTGVQLSETPAMTRRPSASSSANRRTATSAKDVKKVSC